MLVYMQAIEAFAEKVGTIKIVAKTAASEKYIAIHMLSNFAQHIKFLTQHIIVLHSLDNIRKFSDNIWHVFDNIDMLCNYYTSYT